jgi:pilus assembly protein Flp/PilA
MSAFFDVSGCGRLSGALILALSNCACDKCLPYRRECMLARGYFAGGCARIPLTVPEPGTDRANKENPLLHKIYKESQMNLISKTSALIKQRGQGMTEYIIIVALIAIAAIGVYSFFGQTVRQQTAGMAQELSGKSAKEQIQGAQTAAGAAKDDAKKQKGMGDYDNTVSK